MSLEISIGRENATWRRALLVAVTAIYALTLTLCFELLVFPFFKAEGFTQRAVNLPVLVLAHTIAILPSVWIPTRLERPSLLAYWFFFLALYIPSILIPVLTLPTETSGLLLLWVFLLFCFAALGGIYRLPLGTFPQSALSRRQFWWVVTAFTIIADVEVLRAYGFHLHYLGLGDVYSARQDYQKLSMLVPPWVGYFVPWLSNVLNPLLLLRGIVQPSLIWIAIGLLGQIWLYTLTGAKSILFSIPVVFGLCFFWKRMSNGFGFKALGATLALFSICFAMDASRHFIWFESLFVRRVFMIPGLLTGCYFDFFSQNPKLHLSQGVLRHWMTSPYTLSVPNLIGSRYFQDAQTSANANFWADGFANFGYGGILAATAGVALLLWIVDTLAKQREGLWIAVLLALSSFSLINSGLLTCVATHGIALSVLLIYLMPPLPREAT